MLTLMVWTFTLYGAYATGEKVSTTFNYATYVSCERMRTFIAKDIVVSPNLGEYSVIWKGTSPCVHKKVEQHTLNLE